MAGSHIRFEAGDSRAEELAKQNLLAEDVTALQDAPAPGATLADGDYGDVVVSGSGTVLSFDTGVVTAFARTFLDDATAGDVRATLGLGTLATQSGTFSGTSSGTNTGDQSSVTGNAGTATALATPRTISITGKGTAAGGTFDGTGNLAINITAVTLVAGDIPTIAQSQVTDLATDLAAKQPLDAQLTDLATLAYAGNSLKVVRVNVGETAFELATVSGGGLSDGDYGDITVGGTGTTMTIDPGAVTYAKMQDVSAAARLLGRGGGAGSGDPQELTLGAGLSMPGTVLLVNSYEAGPPTPPTTATLATWLNQDASTVTDGTGAMILTPEVNDQVHSRVANVPAAPFDIYCRCSMQILSSGGITTTPQAAAGIVLRDSADSELLLFSIRFERIVTDEQNLYEVRIDRFTADGTFSANALVRYCVSPWPWLRLTVPALTAATLTLAVSMDGRNWITVGTETTAAFIDAITQYGVGAWANAAAIAASASFTYFSTTAPT